MWSPHKWDQCPYKRDPKSSLAPSTIRDPARSWLLARKWAFTIYQICCHLDLGLPSLRDHEEYISVVYKAKETKNPAASDLPLVGSQFDKTPCCPREPPSHALGKKEKEQGSLQPLGLVPQDPSAGMWRTRNGLRGRRPNLLWPGDGQETKRWAEAAWGEAAGAAGRRRELAERRTGAASSWGWRLGSWGPMSRDGSRQEELQRAARVGGVGGRS